MTRILLAVSILLLATSATVASDVQLSITESGLQEGIDFAANGSVRCSYLHNEQVLRLQGYALKDKLEGFLDSHPQVKMLYIGNCGQLSKNDLAAIAEFNHLEYLKLCDVGLTSQQITELIASLPASLLSLDLAGIEITNAGLITLCNAKCSKNLQRLAIQDIHNPEALAEKSLSLLAGSRLSKRLQKLVIPLPAFEEGGLNTTVFDDGKLNKRVPAFREKVLCRYEDFYSDGRELYMLDNPSEKSYIWDYEGDSRWFLARVHPVTGASTSAISKGGSRKKNRDDKDQLEDVDDNNKRNIEMAMSRINLLLAKGLLTEVNQEVSWELWKVHSRAVTDDSANVEIIFE